MASGAGQRLHNFIAITLTVQVQNDVYLYEQNSTHLSLPSHFI